MEEVHSSRGAQFTAQFWNSFQKGLGSKVNLSIAFHPQCNSRPSNIQMAPYEALFGRSCRSPIRWFDVGEARLIGLDLVYQAMKIVKIIQERLKTTQSRQKSYTDVRRRDVQFEVDD
ncbi:hypothetical protein MTR67_002754 [Solanum verrucosum]|uniref:Integrase catalytic domain-containing protein n=1 Tax=Solanum verrucosum TaxID=315347 RepID=A0AAF0T941_SOLVR|nr:hypothetical protein MTR67_002754 [Solanum verrucosum]